MDVFVGWFKRAFVQSVAARLVAQLYTGLTTFDFNKVNTDSTVNTGFNNVYAAKDDDPSVYKKRAIRTVTWIEPVTERAVCTHYEFGDLNDTPSASPTLAIETSVISPFITVDGVYVAHFNEGRTTGFPPKPAENIYTAGGVHIQSISSVDYLVVYQLRFSTNGFEIRKYKTILDMGIEQESIVAMVYDKIVIYTEDENFIAGGSVYHDDAENGSYELSINITTQSRDLTCNADGSKTIFFARRRTDNTVAWADAEYYPIFELTDTESVFEVNEILQYENMRETPGTLSDISTCNGGFVYNRVSTRENCENPGSDYTVEVNSMSGTYTYNRNQSTTDFLNTDFLGCSYDRHTDLPIVIFRKYGQRAFEHNRDHTITRGGSCTVDGGGGGNSSNATVEWVFSESSNTGMYSGSTVDNTENGLVITTIGGTDEVVCSGEDSSTTLSGTASAANTSYSLYDISGTATQSTSKFQVTDYQIVDLSSKMVVYEFHEEFADISLDVSTNNVFANCAPPVDTTIIDFVTNGIFTRKETLDRYYLYVNGGSVLIKDDTTPGTNPKYVGGYNLQDLGTKSTDESAGCAQAPVTDCVNPTKTCIVTESYTCT